MTVEPMEVDAEQATAAPEPPFATISILQLVKDAQQHHGLRHGDYNRYRIYCKDKLFRVRHALKQQNQHKCVKKHKAKFNKRPLDNEFFSDPRYVQLPLFETERRWAQAMHAKTALEDNPQSRQRHVMRSALKRALLHAKKMDEIIKESPRCDAPTKLESQAYLSWLDGIAAFELRDWRKASERLKAAKLVYESLAQASSSSLLIGLYNAKCREIQPQLRLCEFNSAESAGAAGASMSELIQLREQMGSDNNDNIDQLIAEMRAKASTDEVVHLEWGGATTPVHDERVKALVLAWQQTDNDLKQCTAPKEKMMLLEKQIGDTRDCIEKLAESQRKKQNDGLSGMDATEAARLRSYLDFVRLTRTVERYLAIIENTKLEKKVKPQDLLRLYDSVIALCTEITELPGAEEKLLQQAYIARIEYYRAFRCFYMAGAYASLSRWTEAVTLYERAAERQKTAAKQLKQHDGNKYLTLENTDALKKLASELELATVAAQAQEIAATTAEAGGAATAKQIDERPFLETLDEFREWRLPAPGVSTVASAAGAKKKGGKKTAVDAAAGREEVKIATLPPRLKPMPVKPAFFDLSIEHIRMPDLTDRIAKLGAEEKADSKKDGKKGGGSSAAAKEEEGVAAKVSSWFWGSKK